MYTRVCAVSVVGRFQGTEPGSKLTFLCERTLITRRCSAPFPCCALVLPNHCLYLSLFLLSLMVLSEAVVCGSASYVIGAPLIIYFDPHNPRGRYGPEQCRGEASPVVAVVHFDCDLQTFFHSPPVPSLLPRSVTMAGLLATLRYSRRIHKQCRPAEPTFNTDQIPDLSGKVMIVTGGNAGIGRQTVKVLLEHNAKVYMASRDEKKARIAIEELKEQTGKEALYLELNLASLASVRKAASKLSSKEPELHVLFNNAGVSTIPIDWVTDDGYDMTFGTNVIGHFLLTKLLLPALLAGKATSSDRFSRVIWLSSYASYLSTLSYDTFKEGPARRKAGYGMMYFQSKFANVVLAHECARRFGSQGILSLSVNPGNIQTDIMKYASASDHKFVELFLKLYPVEYGVLGQLWAGTMPEALKHNGEYVAPWARVDIRPREDAYQEKVGSKLWDWLDTEVEAK